MDAAVMSEALPFLKWVGGKRKLLPQLLPLLPADVDKRRHVELFAGGAAMFFARAPKRALLSDINEDLIATYRAVRDRAEIVIEALGFHAKHHSTKHFRRARAAFNGVFPMTPVREPAERAALFIYLNKTCFNGLYRVNKRGHFNVPMGRYKNPKICDADGLRAASRALQGVPLDSASFAERAAPDYSIEGDRAIGEGDFVYLDPPYVPVSKTSNFTSYASGGFTREDQTKLRDVFAQLARCGARVMLSNSNTPEVRELYRGFRVDVVRAPRNVSCKADGRGAVNELVVRNYE